MRKLTYVVLMCGMVWCVLMAGEGQARAYVDPGSGLFLLQGISAAFLGVLYAIRRKLKLFMGSKEKVSAAPASTSTEAHESL